MSEIEQTKTYAVAENAQNIKLINELKRKGEDVLAYPTIVTEMLDLSDEDAQKIKNIANFDWLIFVDVHAADYFIEAMRRQETDFFELDNLTVCALGEAVADRLRFVQLHSDVIPSKLDDDAVVAAISAYVGDDFEDLKILVVGGDSEVSNLTEQLSNKRAKVECLLVYSSRFEKTVDAKLLTLIKGGAIDEFIFSSADDVLSLKRLISNESLAHVLNDTKVSAATEIAFQTLREHGLRPLYFHYK